jgi:hypothetical protein
LNPRFLLLLTFAAILPAHATENAPEQNLSRLVIVADDLGHSGVRVQGCDDSTTPRLD